MVQNEEKVVLLESQVERITQQMEKERNGYKLTRYVYTS